VAALACRLKRSDAGYPGPPRASRCRHPANRELTACGRHRRRPKSRERDPDHR
jgi:hypothetical protein